VAAGSFDRLDDFAVQHPVKSILVEEGSQNSTVDVKATAIRRSFESRINRQLAESTVRMYREAYPGDSRHSRHRRSPFPAEKLKTLDPNREAYVAKVAVAAKAARKTCVILSKAESDYIERAKGRSHSDSTR
jgi:hypothetical protein